jgi:PAS domain S-box-containing protein
VTEYTQKLATQVEENEQQFQLICDTMPQMLWTTTPDGYHDYFSQRWYDYTGLTPEQSLGMGWQLPFHPDDMPAAVKAWAHSLATGDEYTTEYRCQRADGAWRWMLGRALPLRDVKTGWFPFFLYIAALRQNVEQSDPVGFPFYFLLPLADNGRHSLALHPTSPYGLHHQLGTTFLKTVFVSKLTTFCRENIEMVWHMHRYPRSSRHSRGKSSNA